MKNVLLIMGNADKDPREALAYALRKRNFQVPVAIVEKTSVHEGLCHFEEYGPILHLVIIGDNIDHPKMFDAPRLLRAIKDTGIRQPVVALTNDEEHRRIMLDNGATHGYSYANVVDELYKILGI